MLVAHSPTPSTVNIAARWYGDGKNALAACDSWCSGKNVSDAAPIPAFSSAVSMSSGIHSFSFSHSGIAIMYDSSPFGATLKYVSSIRLNFVIGLS